jgi:hypothetical protein
MSKLVNLTAVCKPTVLIRNMLRHNKDISEGTKYKIIAKRQILKKNVTFYSNGLRVIEGTDLNEQEMYDSEILRLAHASILVEKPVGDKRACYVDATKNPVEIWIYGMTIGRFLKSSQRLVETQQLQLEFLLEEPIRKTVEKKNGRNVRLFGRQSSNSHLSHQLLVETECAGDLFVNNECG